MNEAFFIQLAFSAAAVGALVAVAAWAKIAGPAGPLDENKARAILAEEFPTRVVDAVWVAADGAGALAKSGALALVVCRVGDGFAARQIPWAQAVSATFRDGRLSIDLGDIGCAARRDRLAGLAAEDLQRGPRRLSLPDPIHATLNPVALATPIFVVTVLAEILLARFGKVEARYEPRDTAVSLGMGLGSNVAGVLFSAISFTAVVWVWQHWRIFDIPMTAWWAWLLVFLAEDLTYYGFHRFSHERRIWWLSHVNHHSSQHYNLTTALRQTWTGALNGSWALYILLSLLGFPPAMVAIQKGVSLVYQYWIHTEAIKKMPRWFEAVFNTPSHHRVHHARNAIYLDRNYAGILIIWDRLFGTFQPELEEEPCRYGLVKNLGTFNILRVAFHEWVAMFQDVVRHPRHAFGYIFGPPGWSHDGSRETSEMIKARVLSPVAAAATAHPPAAPQESPA